MPPDAMPYELLERIWFYTNLNCNLRCAYCVTGTPSAAARAPLDLPLFTRRVDEAAALGFRQVALTGGEPLLHPDIVPMIRYAAARIPTIVLTNGMPVTPPLLTGLEGVDRQRLTFQVSLDSDTPSIHDALRGRGSWAGAVDCLAVLAEHGHTLAVRATLDGQGEGALDALKRYADGYGVPAEQVYGSPVARVGASTHGLALDRARLWPEPTVISDGLYWHPLLIEPESAITRKIEPLEPGLRMLAALADEIKPLRPKEVR
jgi:MoaA/NifB/PqqE/SkfB family radical SAM enzyme